MATGIVMGLPRYRDSWDQDTSTSNDMHTSALPSATSRPSVTHSSHHRSYSDAPESSSRPRLPPISNLFENAGRPQPSYRPTHSGYPVQSPFPGGLTHNRPPPASPDTAMWSPSSESIRTSYQQEPLQRYELQSVSDQHHSLDRYRRASVALPETPSSLVRLGASPGIQLPHVDPSTPTTRTPARNVIGEKTVPGRGACFLFDDGTMCEKIINGDAVNPKWGTTKAGKPRKRLGQACNTCREKKIKCDPSFPKCTQCQKFGRECRFEAPCRTSTKSPKMLAGGSPTADFSADDTIRTRRPSVAPTEASSHSESGTISSRAAGTADENLSPLTNDSNFLSDTPGPSKRAKLAQMDSDPGQSYRSSMALHGIDYAFALENDPFKVNKKMTELYLTAYFSHVNNSMFSLIPERLFMQWAEHAAPKSQVSKLVLYCMLALGCSFSRHPEKASHARVFASIALEGVMQSFGYFSLQLVQARLIFALFEFQNGREERAWDLCGAAVRTACAMNLNTEEGIAHQIREIDAVYGLDHARLAECMRRTFWTAFTMDNLGAACLCITSTFSKADCFLRLPCSRRDFESGHIPQTPYFDGEIRPVKSSNAEDQSRVGTLGHMVQIASLCGDIRALAFRANHGANHGHVSRYLAARSNIESQLRLWNENYLAHIGRTQSQSLPSRAEYPFSFGGLHLVYHYACMQLHRQVPHAYLSRGDITEHVRAAHYHAEKTLAIAEQFTSRKAQDIHGRHFAVASPISGYAIHYAIDILSAAGVNAKFESQSPVLDLVLNSIQLLDTLGDAWSSAKIQKKQVSDRVSLVMNSARAGIAEGKTGFCMEDSMLISLGKEDDLIYGIDRTQYLQSFAWAEKIQGPFDLMMVSSKGKKGPYSVWKD